MVHFSKLNRERGERVRLKDGKSYNQFAHCGKHQDYRESLRESTLCQLHQMFVVDGLPDTIPQYVFLRNAFANGWQWVHDFNGTQISFTGDASGGSGLGPGFDYNYLPTHLVVVNPYLNADGSIPDYSADEHPGGFSGTFPISDGVLIKTTSELMGLDDLVNYFADLEDTAATTLRSSLLLTRMVLNWLAHSDNDYEAMKQYLAAIERGELAVAKTQETDEEAVTLAVGATAGAASLLKSQVEALQYVRGYKWQTFGVQSNHNMKREAINESEAGMNENSLLPLIDDIFNNLKAGLDECNERFGWNASIRYNSAWEEIQEMTEEVEPDGAQDESEAGGNEPTGDNSASDEAVAGDGGHDSGKSVDEQERTEEGQQDSHESTD